MRSYLLQNINMSNLNYVVMLIALTFVSGLCNADTIYIRLNNFISDEVVLSCMSEGGFVTHIAPNYFFVWRFPIGKTEHCRAEWKGLHASFIAYDPQYDGKGADLFWFAKKEGLFHSFDDRSFDKNVSRVKS